MKHRDLAEQSRRGIAFVRLTNCPDCNTPRYLDGPLDPDPARRESRRRYGEPPIVFRESKPLWQSL